MLLLAVALAAPTPATVERIAPPLGVVIRQTIEERRDDGRRRRTFRVARDIVFAPEPSGYRATVTMRSAAADASPAEVRNYRAANAPMIDRAIVIHLDHAGRLRTIDDLADVWDAWLVGLDATRPPRPGGTGAALTDRLRALPQERVAAMVGSVVTDLIASPADRIAAPSRPVTLAGPPPFAALTLTGVSRATADGAGLRIGVTATGSAPAGAGRPAARIALDSERLIDPGSGLQRSASRTERITAPGLSSLATKRITLTW